MKNRNIISIFIVMSMVVIFAANAVAGMERGCRVLIDEYPNEPGLSFPGVAYAIGSFSTVRNSSDTLEFICCQAFADNDSESVSCWARDQNDKMLSCVSWDGKFVRTAAHITSGSKIKFSVDGTGRCSQLSVENGSQYAP